MDLKKYISDTYPIVDPFEGVNSIGKQLLKHHYLMVIDDDKNFYGVLTPSDIIEHPHKIVIDCISKRESITLDDTIITILDKFRSNQCLALPVICEKKIIGVIEKNSILTDLEFKINDLYNKTLISQKAKTYFLNNLSHEIRTPLNGILGFIDIIADLSITEIEMQHNRISKTIRKSADRFLMIMTDLIELSLIHAGDEINIEKTNIGIDNFLIELKDYFDELSLIQNKKTILTYSNPVSSLNIYSDEKKLKQILYHLIDNAVKFSENNKVIYGYELSADKKEIEFFVTNEGCEISNEERLMMFDVFDKQEKIGNKLNPGLGIGLPMVKNLTEILGGHVKVESKNNTTAFFVNIPI